MLQTLGQNSPKSNQQLPSNPFATALAETEKNLGPQFADATSNPLSETVAQSGGDWPQPFQDRFAQEAQLKREQELAIARQKRHDEINPVEINPIFSQEQEFTRKGLEALRFELVQMLAELKGSHKELATPVFASVETQPGSGKGLRAFFIHLKRIIRETIALVKSAVQILKMSVKNSKAWAKVAGGMASKKSKSSFVSSNETAWVQQTMHHEVSAHNSGG